MPVSKYKLTPEEEHIVFIELRALCANQCISAAKKIADMSDADLSELIRTKRFIPEIIRLL